MAGAIFWLPLMLAIQGQGPGPDAGPELGAPEEMHGDCRYAERLRPLLEQNHIFATCTKATVRSDANAWRIAFDNTRSGQVITYSGVWAGGTMEVRTLRLGQREPMAVRGECQRFQSATLPVVLTCIAHRRGRTWVANFESS